MKISRIRSRVALSESSTLYTWEIDEDYIFLEDKVKLSESMWSIYNSISTSHRKTEWLLSKYIIQQHLPNCTLSYCGRRIVVENSSINVSVSHNKNYCCVLISKDRCGVDIESIERNYDKIIHKYLSDFELDLILTQSQKAVAWSAKEALYKMLSKEDIYFKEDFSVRSISDCNIVIDYAERSYELHYYIFDECVVCYCY